MTRLAALDCRKAAKRLAAGRVAMGVAEKVSRAPLSALVRPLLGLSGLYIG